MKRKASVVVLSDSDNQDEIIVARPPKDERSKRRRVMSDTNVAQAQNVTRRTLECVFIPPFSPSSSLASPIASPSSPAALTQQRSAFHSAASTSKNDTGSSSSSARPKRKTAQRSSALEALTDSEDELASASVAIGGRQRRMQVSLDPDSEFEVSVVQQESESEQHSEEESEMLDEPGDSELSSDEGYASGLKKARPANTRPDTTKSKTKATAKNGLEAQAARRMHRLQTRKGDRGLDHNLPPLSNIDDIFADMALKAKDLGLESALKHINRPVRVATMCSGTESPLVVLEQILDKCGLSSLKLDHQFSAEIVPYKQAYIERNFNPPLIFRDVGEITAAVKDEIPMATTAYGAKAQIPMSIDILIAGTSCKDFSMLNNHQRGLDDEKGGESSKTWFGVLAYCKAFRPALVVIENVLHAPWDRMLQYYEDAGYEVAGALVDTKNFYLPQTRQRGYLVGFHKSKALQRSVEGAGEVWASLMEKFQRHASSPVTDFMLPNDVIRVKQQTTLDDSTREWEWNACKIRHLETRRTEDLGKGRPFTHWSESGLIDTPENGLSSWYRKQPERIRDYLEIAGLRKAALYDVRYKCRLMDVSQNVHLTLDSVPFGIIGCITPTGIMFASDAGRALVPEEALALQGLPLNRIGFTTETKAEIQDLAGNAMSTTVVGAAILSALIAGGHVIRPAEDVAMRGTALPVSSPAIAVVAGVDEVKVLETSCRAQDIDLPQLLDLAHKSSRRCLCEGSNLIAAKPIQECTRCLHTTCTGCGGNPIHCYQTVSALNRLRVSPVEFESYLRSKLPLQLAFDHNADLSDYFEAHRDMHHSYVAAVEAAFTATYAFSEVKRTQFWKAIYAAPGARLEVVLNTDHVEWQLFAVPDKGLPSNSPMRNVLEQPVARLRTTTALIDGHWQWRLPTQPEMKAKVRGKGGKISSWLSRLELPKYRDQQVWDHLQISVPAEACHRYGQDVSGLYQALPRCGTAGDSLYKRIEPNTESHAIEMRSQPMYLFRDPTRTGDPGLDCFVFSHDKSRLDYSERRETIARFEPAWTPWSEDVFGDPTLTMAAVWEDLPGELTLTQAALTTEVYVPKSLQPDSADCNGAQIMMRCVLPVQSEASECHSTRLIKANDSRFFADYAWILEIMRRHLPDGEWRDLDLNVISTPCLSCAPERPVLRWMLDANNGTIKPSDDPRSSALFERAVKSQPSPMALGYSVDASSTSLTFGINLSSLAHKAASRLPRKATSLTWKLERNFDQPFSLKPFKLQSTIGQPYANNLHIKCKLFPKQQVVLAWMKKQEFGHGQQFRVEEAEEATLSALGWRAEVRAQVPVHIRGGICADHPGFGKTLTSLALVHSQLDSEGEDAILTDLQQRQDINPTATGLIPIKATLIIAPNNLVRQWATEIADKLGYKSGILLVKDFKALDKLRIKDFETAKIIIVNRAMLDRQANGSNDYAKRLADFAAMPEPATPSGRAFTQWLQHARKDVPAHLKILREEGLSQLKKHVATKHNERLHSEDFKAFVPSKRLIGSEFDQPKKKASSDKVAPSKLSTDKLDRPLLEMFFFNRLIIDEFHDCTPRVIAAINTLCADKRWFLSGTPALNDLYDVAQMARYLGVPLRFGSDSAGVMTSKNIKALRTDMTSFERFDAMRQMPTNNMHARMYEQAQLFLDTFVRQNVMDFAELPISDHLHPVRLDIVHQAIYTELSHRLSAQSMTIRHAKKSKETGQDVRFREAIIDVSTAEEALSRQAAAIDRQKLGANTLVELMTRCEKEVAITKSKLQAACKAAWVSPNAAMDALASLLLDEKGLGDDDTIAQVEALIAPIRKAAPAAKTSKKTKKTARNESEEDGDDEKPKTKSDSTEQQRALTSAVDTIMHEFLRSTRTLRFFCNIRNTQLHTAGKGTCNAEHCHSTKHNSSAVSALCGHSICTVCHTSKNEQLHTTCPADGCYASMHDHDLLWSHTLSDLKTIHPHGAKIDAALRILEDIRAKHDRAVLFVQYKSQLHDVETALKDRGISATAVHQMKLAGAQIEAFQKNNDTVIVLDASNETAAGSNLQCANHVIFLSPLLRDSQYGYHSTMAQAIGRVKRHGQKKHIHIHRIVALHTIDVDILEHRERLSTALTEQGAPDIDPPVVPTELDQHDTPGAERVQLVQENGSFSLRPQHWLYKRGVGGDGEEMARVRGRNRIAGWEDYSSQIKFSRTFTANDS